MVAVGARKCFIDRWHNVIAIPHPFSKMKTMLWIDGSNIWKILHFLTQQALTELLPEEGTCCQRYLCANIFMALMAVFFSWEKKEFEHSHLLFFFSLSRVYNSHPVSEGSCNTPVSLGLESVCVTLHHPPTVLLCFWWTGHAGAVQTQGHSPSICHLSATCHLAVVITQA